MTTLSTDSTIKARGPLQIAKDEIDAQRIVYLKAYESFASNPTDTNWSTAQAELTKLMDVENLYIAGKQILYAYVCGKQRKQ
jgi:hypothetical protein